jgi:hypothetical protein
MYRIIVNFKVYRLKTGADGTPYVIFSTIVNPGL